MPDDGTGNNGGNGNWRKLIGFGQLALGTGLILKGVDTLAGRGQWLGEMLGRGAAGGPRQAPQLPTGAVIQSARLEKVRNIDERVAAIRKLIKKGSLHPRVREAALDVLTKKCGERYCVTEKNYVGEISALFWAVKDPRSKYSLKYIRDHSQVDQFHGADKLLGLHGGDCLPGDTALLTPDGLKPIADVRSGDVVMGDGAWVRVTKWWDRGMLPVRALRLSNGSFLRCTDGHRLFVVPKQRYVNPNTGALGRWVVAGDFGTEKEARAEEIVEGDDLLVPEKIVLGTRHLDPDEAWLLGAFVADGWVKYNEKGEPRMMSLSGKDGHPKEAQKRRAQEIALRKGWDTKWHARWLDLWPDAEWAKLFVECGRLAPNKRLPFIDVDEETARALLSGLAADASRNTCGVGVTYGTTSQTLALQIRLLNRACGNGTSIRRVDDHGGLGKNPIYRIGVTPQETRRSPFARVRSVHEAVEEVPVFDIEVEGQRFYLPEQDIVVHNCDDAVILLGSMLRSVGYPVRARVIQAVGASSWSHIYTLVGIPPSNPTRWIPLDTTVASFRPGDEAPGARETARTGRSSGVVVKLKDFDV